MALTLGAGASADLTQAEEEYSLLLQLLPIICFYFVIINLDGLARIFWIGIGTRAENLAICMTASLVLIVSLALPPAVLGLSVFALMVVCWHDLLVLFFLSRFYSNYLRLLGKEESA